MWDFPETPYQTRDNRSSPLRLRKGEARLRLACPPLPGVTALRTRGVLVVRAPHFFGAGAARGRARVAAKVAALCPPVRGGCSHHRDLRTISGIHVKNYKKRTYEITESVLPPLCSPEENGFSWLFAAVSGRLAWTELGPRDRRPRPQSLAVEWLTCGSVSYDLRIPGPSHGPTFASPYY